MTIRNMLFDGRAFIQCASSEFILSEKMFENIAGWKHKHI